MADHHRVHFGLNVHESLCNAHLTLSHKSKFRVSNNYDLINCGNCIKLLHKPKNRELLNDSGFKVSSCNTR